MNKAKLFGAVLLLLYIVYSGYQLSTQRYPHIFIDNFNLLVHEAGHLVFRPFGEFLTFLGGSAFQILIPIIFTIYFLIRFDFLGLSFGLFWIGDNIINVSVYVSDAKKQVLPLVGGGTHDWGYLLKQTGQIENAELLGKSFFYIGEAFILFSVIILFSFIITSFLQTRTHLS